MHTLWVYRSLLDPGSSVVGPVWMPAFWIQVPVGWTPTFWTCTCVFGQALLDPRSNTVDTCLPDPGSSGVDTRIPNLHVCL